MSLMTRNLVLLAATTLAFAQQEAWRRPFPGHKIAGNLYYIGTEDLACFLITTPEGHILINTGLADSVPMMRESAQKLGFKLEDIKLLLNMQAHFDHVAAMAEIQELSRAKVLSTEADAPALEEGRDFPAVKVDRRIKDGESIQLGGTEIKVILTPGHTQGSVSYSMNVREGGRDYRVLIANMSTVVMKLVGNAQYPGIVDDYKKTLQKQKALKCDIWVAAHASQYNMQEKLRAGSFVDPDGYLKAVAHYEKLFQERLAAEQR
jgi:metallo-beta-lactamase class B